jgi:hypothetical protein
MITTQEIIAIAKHHNAMVTEESHLHWVDTLQEWNELKFLRPSVLDTIVLDRALKVGPSYLEAVQAATGWQRDTVVGFQTAMLLGGPAESAEMDMERLAYWRGILIGSFVYEKIKKRYV